MRSFARAICDGFRGGRRLLAAAVYLYLAALAFAWLASAPFAAALHGVLDGQPGAARMVSDGGIEVIDEMTHPSLGVGPAAFGGLAPLLLVFLPLVLVMAGGAYGVAAERPPRPFSRFWISGTRRFGPYLARAALSGVYGAAVVATAWGVEAGLAAAFDEPSGPVVFWTGIGLRALVVAAALLHARTVAGVVFAAYESGSSERLVAGFLAAVALCFRRLAATHGLGAVFLALQAGAALLSSALARAAGEGGAASAAFAQAGWLAVAWLRVSEIRARIVYVALAVPAPTPPPPTVSCGGGGSEPPAASGPDAWDGGAADAPHEPDDDPVAS